MEGKKEVMGSEWDTIHYDIDLRKGREEKRKLRDVPQ